MPKPALEGLSSSWQVDAEGNVVPVLQESVDDDWLLISAENEE